LAASFICIACRYACFDDGMSRAELLRYAACPDISDPSVFFSVRYCVRHNCDEQERRQRHDDRDNARQVAGDGA